MWKIGYVRIGQEVLTCPSTTSKTIEILHFVRRHNIDSKVYIKVFGFLNTLIIHYPQHTIIIMSNYDNTHEGKHCTSTSF